MKLTLQGRARIFGDDVNTDYIISSSRKRETLNPDVLKAYLFETLSSDFATSVRPGDLLVAGRNFGCGSAMEVAATVVLGAGIRAVLAQSFARTYYRNAINNGLLPIECDTRGIKEGDRLLVDFDDAVAIHNKSRGETLAGRPLPTVMREILDEGGLIPYIRRYRGFRV